MTSWDTFVTWIYVISFQSNYCDLETVFDIKMLFREDPGILLFCCVCVGWGGGGRRGAEWGGAPPCAPFKSVCMLFNNV